MSTVHAGSGTRRAAGGRRDWRRARWWSAIVAAAGLICAAIAVSAVPANAATVNGNVFSWGKETYGELGNGGSTLDTNLAPAAYAGPDVRFTQISSSAGHYLALAADGTVWGWGDNGFNQLLGGPFDPAYETTPVQIPGLTGVRQVAAGGLFSLALKYDGTVWEWGEDLVLGDNQCTDLCINNIKYPTQVGGVSGIVQIAASATHALLLRNDGAVLGWGDNPDGVLGTGDTNRLANPTRISGLPFVTAIATGTDHSLVYGSDHVVYGFGSNAYGQSGLGSSGLTRNLTPTPVVGISSTTTVRQLAAGYGDSFAVLGDGTVAAWGRNDSGQLGTGDRTNRSLPILVRGVTGASSVAAGGLASYALVGGHVWSWGDNVFGELGVGNTTAYALPQQIPSLSGVVSIAASIGTAAAAVDPPGTITMALNPSSATVVAGNGVSTTLSLAPSVDVAGLPVALSVSGLPAGAGAAFSTTSTPVPNSSSTLTTLTLYTSTWTTAGTYTLTVTGVVTSLGLTTSRTFTLGITPAPVSVPNVLSLSQSEATSVITGAGLVVGTVSYTNNCVDPGSVQTQNPIGGTLVPRGSAVNITVSTCTTSGGGGGLPK